MKSFNNQERKIELAPWEKKKFTPETLNNVDGS